MRKLTAVLLLVLSGALHAAGLVPDHQLERRVKGNLSATIGAPARNIEVVAMDGAVWLHGRIATLAAREAAANAAERTPGVRVVLNNLVVPTDR